MKTSHTIGIIFIVNAMMLWVITKMWFIGLPMAIIGLCFLTGIISDDNNE
ncbi:hypothetical protein ACMZ62_04345 [Streptococcus pluranimalium]|nr:hypothetical protein [Streptococcus hyovaginalis]MDY4510869.1 hypothetical protein [Streptococcus hyovaginalis]MDY5973562.1 hypothetical protein [Streptococcus hyovaginalis]